MNSKTTEVVVPQQERVDDVPLLLGMMRRMQIAEIIDRHVGQHHLQQGLSLGNLAVGWIAYILSESDHRKSAVQAWAQDLEQTLTSFFGPLRPQEFSDDRLGIVLKHLATVDWTRLEGDLFDSCFEVYALPSKAVHVDATTTCGYHTIEPDGLMQLGHSKDHRPDLPQLKIMAAVTQPLAFPLFTDIVAGHHADDGLYWPIITKVKEKLATKGLLFSGDCKMAALATRARLAAAKDYYLTALPWTGVTAQQRQAWIDTALDKEAAGQLQAVYQRPPKGNQPPALIAKGYEFTRPLQTQVDGRTIDWTERVQVVQSLAQWQSQKTKLEKNLQRAEEALWRLTLTGKGRKVWRQAKPLRQAIAAIEQEHDVEGLLQVRYRRDKTVTRKYTRPGRPRATATADVEVSVRYRLTSIQRNDAAIQRRQQRLGWRVLVTNAPAGRLSLEGSVWTYREGGGLERPFHQLKDLPLGLSPLFVRRNDQVLGLTHLVLIALRVLSLLEIVLRGRLAERGQALPGLYEGQKNKKESRPTARRTLRAVAGLKVTLSLVAVGQRQVWHLSPLPPLLIQVLDLLGLSSSLYTNVRNTAQANTTHSPVSLDPSG